MSPGGSRSRAGFTLVELVIAAAVLLLLLSSAVMAARGGMGAFRATQDTSQAETRVRRGLDRAVLELLSAGASELLPDPTSAFGTDSLQFRRATGLAGTAVVWGETQQLAFAYAPGEADDGLDNDGNGLVDDGLLVLTRDPGGDDQRVVLCRGVREFLEGELGNGADDNGNGILDEAGFNVRRVNDVLFVRLSVEEPVETGTIVRTLETSVRLRN
jgi:prepilin-type N-terminal cleavage/methylation domain-containing protein